MMDMFVKYGSGDGSWKERQRALSLAKVSVRKSAPIANYDRHPAAWVYLAVRLPAMETRRCETAAVESA